MNQPDDPLRSRRAAAQFLTQCGYPVASATLAKYASVGGGPIFESFGRKALYRESNLLAWAEARTSGPRRSTSDPGSRRLARVRPVKAERATNDHSDGQAGHRGFAHRSADNDPERVVVESP
jgi:hypothetical protein